MLSKRIIACLDVRDGSVVKGVNFEGLTRAGDPADLARRYNAEGIDEVVILEGTAQWVGEPDHPIVAPAQAATQAKHPEAYGGEEPTFNGFWILRPSTVYAWAMSGFPRNMTVWHLD